MSSPPRGNDVDAVTQVQADAGAYANTALREYPELRWTDATGARAVTLRGRAIAGSGAGVDLIVADPTVSRLHAEFEVCADGVWVRDLGSRNGTFVGEIRIGSARLPEGALVRLGGATVRLEAPAMPTAVDLWSRDRFGPLVGRSAVMRELFARLARVAATDATVLVQGETGTGKELVAQALHEASPRAAAPFVVVDCAALPENLLEGELFGHARGAFTGATHARAGVFEQADGGTVFLDEIGELPLAMQPKLLRVLETRAVRRLGEGAYRKVDVRVLAATHRDLRTMVNAGTFREDLYFRVAVVPVTVPPLRARPDDLPLLVARFVPAGAAAPFDAAQLRGLAAGPWPGNVRELRNVVERAVALGPFEALGAGAPHRAPVSSAPRGGGATPALPPVPTDRAFKEIREQWVEHLEREYLRALLARHGHNVSAVAKAAQLDRAYIYRLMKKHEL